MLTFTLAALSSHAHYDALTHELEIRPYGWIDIDGSHNFDDWLTLPRGEATRPGPAAQVVMFGTTGPYNRGGAVLGLRLADALTERDPGDHGAYVLGLGPIDEHWDRWTAPDIGATELVDTFDLDPLPSPVQLAEEAGLRGLDVDPDCR